MVVTVMKTTFPKAKPNIIHYRDYKRFNLQDFRRELRNELRKAVVLGYAHFEHIFLTVLEKHAPMKQRTVRANEKPYMTKVLRQAIMRRSFIVNSQGITVGVPDVAALNRLTHRSGPRCL